MSEDRTLSSRGTIDERIGRWLEHELSDSVPDRVLDAAFVRTEELAQEHARRWHLPFAGGWRGRALLAIAAVLATTLAIVGPGALRRTPEQTSPPLLAELHDLGRIRIAVRPDHPQFQIGGQAATGFDTDVADELAHRLGLRAELEIVDISGMLRPDEDAWDAALPSVPLWTVDVTRFATSTAYYYWPHRLVVPIASTATAVSDVANGPICAVTGDAGAEWLSGTYAGTRTDAITTSIVNAASDADCLSAIASGTAIAAVTAHLSDADLQVRSDIRVIGGPDPEPRPVVVRRQVEAGPDPGDLLDAINDALAAMRADGTLARLSERRFGGADLSNP